MSKGISCSCPGKQEDRLKNWRIIQYKCNHSAFSGGHYTPSDYSCFRCIACDRVWRSKSDYVYAVQAQHPYGKHDPWERREPGVKQE